MISIAPGTLAPGEQTSRGSARRALWLAATIVSVGALACGASGPAYAPEVTALAKQAPTSGPAATPATCATAEACRAECSAGAASACTIEADFAYAADPARAEAMWVDACRRRDGEACLRLMAITAATPSIADAYAHHACSYGVAAGCEMRGTDQLLRALPDGDRGALREAAQTLGRACEADDWSSCLWEALAAGQPGADKPADYAQARRQRAFELAATACDARDATACGFRAETLSEAGQAAAARSAYAKGCMVVLTSRTDEPYAALLDHPVCQRAHKLAVAPPEASATPSADGARALPASALESRRASGDAQVEPDHDVRTQLQRVTKATRLTTEISLCVSRAGLVREVALWRSSGFAPYDRQVLQAARGWRFRPYLVQGAPTPVCSQVSSSHQHHPSLSEPQKRPPGAGGW